jgi:hypothetical protein
MFNVGMCRINFSSCEEYQTLENEFRSPEKINYKIKLIKAEKDENLKYEEIIFIDILHGNRIKYPWLEEKFYKYKKEKSKDNNNKIIICHIKNKNQTKNSKSILYCHNNNTTLGDIYPFLCDLCSQLRCDVISFDYSGYGYSDGITNIENCFNDTYSTFYFSNKYLKLTNFIILGFGLGAIPALKLCSVYNLSNHHIKGLILYSPILDKYYLNMCNINNINCPLFALHGKLNNNSSYEKTFALAKFFSKRIEWYPKNCRYNKIHCKKRYKFYKKINIFFKCIDSDNINNDFNKNVKRFSIKDEQNNKNSGYRNIIVSDITTSTSTNDNPNFLENKKNLKLNDRKTLDRRTVISKGIFDSEY